MHEMSVMEKALEIALDHAARRGANRITSVTLRIGALSGVVPEALEFAFGAVTQGTIAEGARLQVDPVSAACFCPACELEFEPPDLFYECPRCQQLSAVVRRGRELELACLEVT